MGGVGMSSCYAALALGQGNGPTRGSLHGRRRKNGRCLATGDMPLLGRPKGAGERLGHPHWANPLSVSSPPP